MNAKILVIDDDPEIVETYRDILGDVGFELQACHKLNQALSLLDKDNDWDVILLDAQDFSSWIESPNRINWLKDRIQQAAMRA